MSTVEEHPVSHMVRPESVIGEVRKLFGTSPAWFTFFREVFGLNGIIRESIPNDDRLAEYERSPDYQEAQRLLACLRQEQDDRYVRGLPREPHRVITIRIPKSIHEMLREESEQFGTSMNKLCVSKLVQPLPFYYREKQERGLPLHPGIEKAERDCEGA